MIMNRVLLLLMVWFCACSPENTEIFDLSSSVDDIKLIKLRADHKTLVPNGVSKMGSLKWNSMYWHTGHRSLLLMK